MLQNLTNFFSLITGGLIKTKPDATDLIALGTKNPQFTGGYRPSGITYENLKADILSEVSEEKGCGVKFGLNWASVGPKVSFKKTDYAIDFRDVIIPGQLELTRKNNQGLYNAALESGWNGSISPEGTAWNSENTDLAYYGWGNLGNVIDRSFGTFSDAIGNLGCYIVGKELLFRHGDSGRLWIIKFTEWTQNGEGGGFAYDRWEIFPTTFFYRPFQSPLTVDQVSEGLIIKRDNVRGIYNAVLENRYDTNCENSPLGTEWNSIYTDPDNYGTTNLANVRNRKYSTWQTAVDGNPNVTLNDDLQLIMHDLSTDLYWYVQFQYWGNGDAGPNGEFSYIRALIPQDCGIEFNDGTVMTTAATGGGTTCCPVLDSEGNLIIDNNSSNTVSVGPGGTQFIPNFSGFLLVNDHFDGGVETWIAGGGDTICLGATNTGGGPVGSSLTISGTGYIWQNDSNMNGPFTFTVIKTRNEA